MVTDRYPSFDDLPSLAAYLLNSVEDLLEVRGFAVDKKQGTVTPLEEYKNGNVTEIYSEEVKRQFKQSIETALVMSMQLLLLARLADHVKEAPLQQLIEKNQAVANVVRPGEAFPLERLLKDLAPPASPLRFFSPQPTLTPIEGAIFRVLAHHRHELSALTSLQHVNALMTQIEQSTKDLKPSKVTPSKRG